MMIFDILKNILIYRINKWSKYVIFILIVMVLLVLKLYLFYKYNTCFHQIIASDYSTHSLGHGINIDFWLNNGLKRKVGYFQTTDPGTLFQVTSGIVYKISTISLDGNHYTKAISTILNPKTFWFFNQAAAFFVFIISLFMS